MQRDVGVEILPDSFTSGNTSGQSKVQGDDRDVQGMRRSSRKNGTAERSKSCIIDLMQVDGNAMRHRRWENNSTEERD
jgi:hypothetical protein